MGKGHSPEQIVRKLRQAEPQACRSAWANPDPPSATRAVKRIGIKHWSGG
jgi:hypothetical protein